MSNERKYNTFSLPYNKDKRKRTKISPIEIINPTTDTFISKSTILSKKPNQIFKTKGHLYTKPIHTAFNKTSLGCIPCKIEKTLIKTEAPIDNTLLAKSFKSDFESTTQFSNEEFNPFDLNKNSFNSKGTLNGFVSNSERFINLKDRENFPSPDKYNIELNNLLKNIEKSNRAKGLFKSAEFKSTNNNKKLNPGPCDYNPKKLENNKKYKASAFDYTEKRFVHGPLNTVNNNPGPGNYFDNIYKYKIKNENNNSPSFMQPTAIRDIPENRLKINSGDFKDFGYILKDTDKFGLITTYWNNLPKISKGNYDYNLKELEKIFKYDVNNKFGYHYNVIKNKKNPNDTKIDNFALFTPRWKETEYENTNSKFRPPGPAYYEPKIPAKKESFNVNTKDFIYVNSVPYIEKHDTSNF